MAGVPFVGGITYAEYPLDEVREAYEQLEARHTLGKIVLIP